VILNQGLEKASPQPLPAGQWGHQRPGNVGPRDVLEALVAGEDDVAKLADRACRRLRNKIPELQTALQGRVTAHHRFQLRILLNHGRHRFCSGARGAWGSEPPGQASLWEGRCRRRSGRVSRTERRRRGGGYLTVAPPAVAASGSTFPLRASFPGKRRAVSCFGDLGERRGRLSRHGLLVLDEGGGRRFSTDQAGGWSVP
jgi:hypothetical protein